MNFQVSNDGHFGTVKSKKETLNMADVLALIAFAKGLKVNKCDDSDSDDILDFKGNNEDEKKEILDNATEAATSSSKSQNSVPNSTIKTFENEPEDDDDVDEWEDEANMLPCACHSCKLRKSRKF